jgi:triosephosphate isomerase
MHPSRRPLIAGNWKMHLGGLAGVELAMQVKALSKQVPHVDLLVSPPFTAIAAIAHELDGTHVAVAGQNMHAKPSGAFTGEVSAPMLLESGASWIILGHSERRQLFGERDADVAAKIHAAISSSLVPIVCVGETLAEREAGKALDVVGAQIAAVLDVFATVPSPAAIAYEPVWAIGTGKTASPADAEQAHAAIRKWLAARSEALASRTRILYGGSVKADNASSLLSEPNVDGALIGGASLEIGSFGAIAMAAEALARAFSV